MNDLPVDHFVKAQQFVQTTHRDVYPAIDPTQASLSQKGRVVIITGASQGIGARAFVPSFAAAGAKAIVLVARSADKLKDVAELVATSHPNVETLSVSTDIADPASVAALFDKVKEKYGHADVLVNNAGIFKAIAPIKDVDHVAWWEEMTLNIRGTFLMTQSFLKQLPSPETPARIVTLTTGAAYEVFPTFSAYGMSKLAVFELMTYVAVENPNVVAVALHPGMVDTEMMKDMFKKFALDTPELVGGVGVWLAAWDGLDRAFLSGRFVTSNWDVEDLVKRKEEILAGNLLKMDLNATLGAAQFGL
ncbi:NAD(P)-binding protein [Cucurbitaria berberidis CBS 394.84]|uniref:NAD(P)-binding protein n=1 Tax=Cucurbitaria berberidis CBS 394.84 TaxID=1168544 RepID=A0A9P4LA09_9PLEO|nr:NAD(P)-binding protein [Cucurbitaria berberidis CBS 394.84]KAF1847866.1 NAD(P)-binding protein [Cucurbitaria berberidis CBS 394.84]